MRKASLFLLFLLAGIIIPTRHSIAQLSNLHFDLITETNGLSNRSVGSIIQDHSGYIWFATADGLNRFDGYSFKVFTKIQGDSNSLLTNYTTRLVEDQNHLIWIGLNPSGLDCYDPVTEKFTHYKHDDKVKTSIPATAVQTLFVDLGNNLWIATAQNGVSLFDRKTKSFKNFDPLPDIKKEYPIEMQKNYNTVYNFYEDDNGLFWLATHNGLYSFNKETGVFEVHRNNPVVAFKWRDDLFKAILNDSDLGLWLAGYGCGLNYFDFKTKQWTNYKYDLKFKQDATKNIVNTIAWKNKNELWIGTNDRGLGIFNINKKEFVFFDEKLLNESKLPAGGCTKIFIDHDQNTWIATENGLGLLRSSSNTFSFIPLQVSNTQNGEHYTANAFLIDKKHSKLYVATGLADGLNIIYEKTNHQKHIAIPVLSTDENFMSINDLMRDSRGNAWMLTRDYLFNIDEEHEQLIKVVQPPFDTSLNRSQFFVKMYEDVDGNLWLASLRSGVYKYNPTTQTYLHFKHNDNDSTSICSNNISSIVQDKQKRIWFGSGRKGLSMLKPGRTNFVNFYHSDNDTNSLANDMINGLAIDKLQNIWIASFGGLSKLKDQGNGFAFTNYGLSNGLPSELLFDLKCDNQGTLWFVTMVALSKMNPQTMQIKSYTSRNGLQESVSQFSLCPVGDEMFIGSWGGYYRFKPEDLSITKPPPNVVINSFKIFDDAIPFKELLKQNKNINLSYKQNFFSFDFAAINFSDPEKNQYGFMLQGVDKQWINCGIRRFASYTNIEGGDYIFKVKSANSDGIWSEPIEIPIHIENPYWKKTWFIFLVAFLSALIIYAFYRMRINNIRKTENLKTAYNKKIAEVEMTALRAQMNPHFIFNCLNSINRYIVKSDNKTASLYLTKFSKLIRLILDNSNNKNVVLSNEIEALKLYIEMESLRFDNKFSYQIKTGTGVNPDNTEVPPLIIQPYVENAIWHGLLHKEAGGKLLVDISRSNGTLKCIVEDDGVGRDAAKEFKSKSATTRKSLGMKLTEDRINILNHYATEKAGVEIVDLKDEKGESTGTRVIIRIPV